MTLAYSDPDDVQTQFLQKMGVRKKEVNTLLKSGAVAFRYDLILATTIPALLVILLSYEMFMERISVAELFQRHTIQCVIVFVILNYIHGRIKHIQNKCDQFVYIDVKARLSEHPIYYKEYDSPTSSLPHKIACTIMAMNSDALELKSAVMGLFVGTTIVSIVLSALVFWIVPNIYENPISYSALRWGVMGAALLAMTVGGVKDTLGEELGTFRRIGNHIAVRVGK